jgi:hypothetical protein
LKDARLAERSAKSKPPPLRPVNLRKDKAGSEMVQSTLLNYEVYLFKLSNFDSFSP